MSLTGTVNSYVYFFEGLTLAIGSFSSSFTFCRIFSFEMMVILEARALRSESDELHDQGGMAKAAASALSEDLAAKCLQGHHIQVEDNLI